VKVLQAYKYAIDHTPRDERGLRSHAGAKRFAWNWGLARCRERHDAEGKWYSAAELHKLWNTEKKQDPALAWWSENSKCAYQEAFRDLERALRDFVKSKKGQRKGKRLGFPRFKKRGKCRDSFRFGAGVMRCEGTTVTLPRLGTLRTHESTEELASLVRAGRARILSATVSRTAQRWFVSFAVEVERDVPEAHARPGTAIGIDLGVKTLLTAVDNTGNIIEIPGQKPLRVPAEAAPRVPRLLPQAEGLEPPAQGGGAPRPDPRQGRERPGGRAPQGHHPAGGPVRDRRGRGPERDRDDREPEAGPRCRRPGIR
jgi:putative transposase